MCSRQRLAACRAAGRGAPSRRAAAPSAPAGRCAASRGRARCACSSAQRAAQQPQPSRVREQREDQPAQGLVLRPTARGRARPGRGSARSGVSYCTPDGHAVTQAMQPRQASQCDDHRVAHRLALEALLHQVDPAARGVHLLAPQHVGRAGRQAEPAVHAVADQRRVRRVVLVEGAAGRRACRGRRCCPVSPSVPPVSCSVVSVTQMPPTNRPGASRWSGSNWSLTRRIRSSAGHRSPHVDGGLDGGGRVDDDGAAAVPGADVAQPRRAPRRPPRRACRPGARRRRRRRRPSRAGAAPVSRGGGQHVGSPESTKVSLRRWPGRRRWPRVPRVRRPAGRRVRRDSVDVAAEQRRGPSRPGRRRPSSRPSSSTLHGARARRRASRPRPRRARPGRAAPPARAAGACAGSAHRERVTQRLRRRQRVQPERRLGDRRPRVPNEPISSLPRS